MPGLLQTEALVQMAALTVLTLPGNKEGIIYLYNVEKISFKQKVLIGVNSILKLNYYHGKEA